MSAARGRVSPRQDYEASVRVAGKGYGTGRVGHMEFCKQNGWNGYVVVVLERVRVMEKCELEFWCGVTWSVTR